MDKPPAPKNPALTIAILFSNTRLSRVRVGSLRGTVLLNS